MKIFTIADVPEDLAQKWLQHLRDFDAANPGCHFEVRAGAPAWSVAEIIERITVDPASSFTYLFERGA
jgi:hypothetical protein